MASNDCGAVTEEADTAVPVLVRWTLEKPRTTAPPKSDDYTTWTVKQLRKERTSRKIRLNRKTSTDERIKLLVELDEYHLDLIAKTLHAPVAPSKKMKQGMMATMKGITTKLLDSTSSSVDSILKMHKLTKHVELRVGNKGRNDAALERSLVANRDKLLEMETRLCKED
ncbi:hypothetical protein PI126_g15742 [Phytophthora idaei]|nr:hypothetical protein PI126_g15742 [Phytophthora idaei]